MLLSTQPHSLYTALLPPLTQPLRVYIYANSFSGLARALNTVSQSLSIAQALLPAAAAQTSAAASTVSHYVKNQRIRRFNVELVQDDGSPPTTTTACSSTPPSDLGIPLGPRRPSHVFTNLALGNCMETLMGTGNSAALPSTPRGTFRFSLDPTTIPNSVEPPPVVVGPPSAMPVARPPLPDHRPTTTASPGIPIPQLRRESSTGYAVGSPPTGRYSHQQQHQSSIVFSGGSAGTSPSQMATGGVQYLDVYGSGGSSISAASISRATTPQRQTQITSGSVGVGSAVSGDFRLGRVPIQIADVFVVCDLCVCRSPECRFDL